MRLLRRLSPFLALALAACAARGPYTWVDRYAAPAPSGAYTVGVGDVVSVSVFGSDRMSARSKVRADGRISVPLLNDVDAVGRTPTELAADIERRLRAAEIVNQPRVTVQVDEVRALSVAVLGAVPRAGTYALDQGAGVAEALAAAGGLTEFAHRDRIYVLRRGPKPERIRFAFDALTSVASRASVFRLLPGDVVVAE